MIIDTVRSNFKIIIFGFVFTFFSSIGQSFFIGLFNSNIRGELNITHGEFGTIYGVATLCSSMALIWLGKKIDDLKLVNYSILVVIFLFFATLFFSFINGMIFLFFGIFFLRLSGQGLMAHTASTSVSRYFEKRRGKALSYIWIGMSLGEFLLPILFVYLLSFIYWRDLWIQTSIFILVTLPIFSFFMVKDISIFSREEENENKKNKFSLVKSWTRKEVSSDF
jgi:MFS family permease